MYGKALSRMRVEWRLDLGGTKNADRDRRHHDSTVALTICEVFYDYRLIATASFNVIYAASGA